LTAVSAYNVLTLDGGGIRGMIGCIVIDHMEKEAYKYAENKTYTLTKYNKDHKKIHMN
jgi:patatin-like phospholipase/acyl hydrolase